MQEKICWNILSSSSDSSSANMGRVGRKPSGSGDHRELPEPPAVMFSGWLVTRDC